MEDIKCDIYGLKINDYGFFFTFLYFSLICLIPGKRRIKND